MVYRSIRATISRIQSQNESQTRGYMRVEHRCAVSPKILAKCIYNDVYQSSASAEPHPQEVRYTRFDA